MAITIDASTSSSGYSQSSGFTVSHTCSGSNRALTVSVVMGASDPTTSFTSLAVTYNGVSMTSAVDGSAGNRRVAIFRLVAPATGANNIAVTWGGGGTEIRIFNMSFNGVDQNKAVNASGTSSASGAGTTITQSVTNLAVNSMIVGSFILREGGLGATSIISGTSPFSSDQTAGAGYYLVSSLGSNSIGWNVGSGGLGTDSRISAVALSPADEIALDAITTKDAGNVSSSTLSHTCSTGATMLAVSIGADSGASPTGVTYNGVAMTKEATQAGLDTTIWTLANPATGANNIVVTFAASHYFGIVGMSFLNTATTSYTDGTNTGTGTTNNASISVTTGTNNSWVVLAGSHNRNSSRIAISGSYIAGDIYVTTDNFRVLGIVAPNPTAGAKTVGWTMGTASDGWYAAAVGIKQVASATNSNFLMFM
jgi:hypothetical protein